MISRICTGSLVFIMFTCGCGCLTSSDKWNHIAFSASLSSVTVAASSKPVEAVTLTVGLGLIKEIYDGLRGSGFDFGDLAADIAGAVAGGIATAEICMEEFP